jgi:hypothetical protein
MRDICTIASILRGPDPDVAYCACSTPSKNRM